MATVKITVTVPEELASYIRERVAAREFESISAFVTLAAQSYRDVEPLDLLIASMVAETGPPSPEAEAWADSALQVARKVAGASQPGSAA
jgi:Arc/MetJ-type ribon-helix-helix transcriptional regulator